MEAREAAPSVRRELRDKASEEAKKRKNKRAVADDIGISPTTFYKFLEAPEAVANDTVQSVQEWIERGFRPRSDAELAETVFRAAHRNGTYADRRLEQILSSGLDPQIQSTLMLDAAIVLRAEAIRDRDRTALVEAELAAGRHQELAAERARRSAEETARREKEIEEIEEERRRQERERAAQANHSGEAG